MAGILNIAATGLNAFKYALSITSNNIANSTDRANYTRQTAEFSPLPTKSYGTTFIGSGVYLANVKRNSDSFATDQVRTSLTSKTEYDAFYQQALQIDKLMSQQGVSLSGGLQSFFDALSKLNNAPDNLASRDLLMQQSEMLVGQFSSLQLRLNEYQQNNNAQIQEAVNQINQITSNIAAINSQLSAKPDASDLLDKRDELLRELSKFTQVTVVDLGNNQINVIAGTGATIVMGTEQSDLVAKTGPIGQYNRDSFSKWAGTLILPLTSIQAC